MTRIKDMSAQVDTWRKFARVVRSNGCKLLVKLDKFNDPVLVSGCQRSGTTAVSRLITASDGMVNYWFGRDDELDAALILSGYVEHEPRGRYCFQTTYLNQCYPEYFDRSGQFRLIWLVRNPYSVVYSMTKNWGRFAFNELFDACGSHSLTATELKRYRQFGKLSVPRLRRACLSYNGKVSQLFEIIERLGKDRVAVLDYDEFVRNKATVLPVLYDFIDLPYSDDYCAKIHGQSVDKARELSQRSLALIEVTCGPIYEQARAFSTFGK